MGVFITATRATFRLCMGLLSARCSSSGGSIWRLQSAWKLLANLTSTSLNIPLGKWKRGPRSVDSSKHLDGQKSNCCKELSHLYRSIHNGMKVSIMPLKTAIAHTGWVAVSVWMSFASSPSMYVVSFSPTGHPVNSVMVLLQVPM